MLHSCRDHGKSDANIPIHTGAPGEQQDGFPPPNHQRQGDPVSPRVRDSLLVQENIRPFPAVSAVQHHQQPLLHPAQGTTGSSVQCQSCRAKVVSIWKRSIVCIIIIHYQFYHLTYLVKFSILIFALNEIPIYFKN